MSFLLRGRSCPGRDLALRALAVLCLGAASLFQPALAAEPLHLAAGPIDLNPDEPGQEEIGKLIYRGGLELHSRDARFGGVSGLSVSADGTYLTAVTDQGHWFRARLAYDDAGRLVNVADGQIGDLPGHDGATLRGKFKRDAESLAPTSSGFVVGFEHDHRLWFYSNDRDGAPFTGAPFAIAPPAEMARAPANGGMEAVDQLDDGRLMVLTERLKNPGGGLSGWLGMPTMLRAKRSWGDIRWLARDGFAPTGLAAWPAGGALVLERRYNPLLGVAARISLIRRASLYPGAHLWGETLARLDQRFNVDNFEGIAARTGAPGETLIYIVSDDNFSASQRTLLMLFAYRAEPG